ncbi:MAG: DUF2974 domain-containing protein [Acholeplasmatales bacterium]|nr:DUF2974 domain-containing protein [Acholeplasmatales bacterium]
MLYKVDEILLLENLTYMADVYPFTNILRAKGKTVKRYLSEIDMDAIEDENDYASYMPGIDWKNIIYAINNNQKLLDAKIVDTNLDTAYGGGGGISVLYINEADKEAVVAFRGTADREWIDDFLGANQTDSLQQINALEWYNLVYDRYNLKNYTITVTGHSKGGNKAKYITILNNTVSRCISFDGQGFSDKFMEIYKKQILKRQDVIENHNIDFDYVNILMNDIGKRTFYYGYNYGRGGFAEAHCPNTFFDFKENGEYEIHVNPNGQRPEMIELNKYINNMIRNAIDDTERSKNNKLVGMLVEKAFSIGTDDNTTAKYISFLCDMVGDPKYSKNAAYLLSFNIKYSKENPNFLGALKGIMTYFKADGIAKVIDMLDDLVNSKKLGTILGVSNFLITHVNGIVVKKVQSIVKKKYDVELSKEQVQRVLQIISIMKGMLKSLELSMDGSGLIVDNNSITEEKFELPECLNIVVLTGGLSSYRNLSINTGYNVANALKEKGHNVILLDSYMGYGEEEINIDDAFKEPDKYSMEISTISEDKVDLWAVKKRRNDQSNNFFGPNVIQICKQSDIVFIALHNACGENGKVQATLDLFDIDYTGCDYFVNTITSDIMVTRRILAENGIMVPKSYKIKNGDITSTPDKHNINYPVVIKYNNTGFGRHIEVVKNENEFINKMQDFITLDGEIVVEEYLYGRDFVVGTLDNNPLPVLEILPLNSKKRQSELTLSGVKANQCPAEISDELKEKLKEKTEFITKLLGLTSYSKISYVVNDDNIYCINCDSLPELDKYSHVIKEANQVGISYSDFLIKIIELSLIKGAQA